MSSQTKDVFMIKQYQSQGETKVESIRVGIAIVNQDGSWSVLLNVLPGSGRLLIRDSQRKKKETGQMDYLPFEEAP